MRFVFALAVFALVALRAAGSTAQAPVWYWCDAARAYWPYVAVCPGSWRAIDPASISRQPYGAAPRPVAPSQGTTTTYDMITFDKFGRIISSEPVEAVVVPVAPNRSPAREQRAAKLRDEQEKRFEEESRPEIPKEKRTEVSQALLSQCVVYDPTLTIAQSGCHVIGSYGNPSECYYTMSGANNEAEKRSNENRSKFAITSLYYTCQILTCNTQTNLCR